MIKLNLLTTMLMIKINTLQKKRKSPKKNHFGQPSTKHVRTHDNKHSYDVKILIPTDLLDNPLTVLEKVNDFDEFL